MDDIARASEVLYLSLCRKIGTPTEVTIRRDARDMKEMIEKPVHIYKGMRAMLSGSNREGFRLGSSDMDWMLWCCNHKLISDISLARLYDSTNHTILLMEDNNTPPGFVKLQLLTSPRDDAIRSSGVPVNDRVYISSLLWQGISFEIFRDHLKLQRVTTHGPCTNGYHGPIENDLAVCIVGTHWPILTLPWIERCFRHDWPPPPVLEEILKNGYHCVPIGSKVVSSGNLLEWRLSFSQAELKLVSTMNHTQFLVYGFLKIFLKEIINHGVEEPLLCSYFLKTTVFWMIQLGSVEWRPNNLLHCFWKCFKYLIHCVYRGVFPNFFIPQNNMFINKVVGAARTALLEQLYHYYNMGVSCLLLSPNIRSILKPALIFLTFKSIFEPALSIPTLRSILELVLNNPPEGYDKDVVDLDIIAMAEIIAPSFSAVDLSDCFILLSTVHKLSRLSLSPYQTLTLQYYIPKILVRTAFTRVNNTSYNSCKNVYKVDRIVCNMLKLASRVGTVSHSLYLALYYYRTGRYNETLRVTYLTKQRLSQPYIMFYNSVDRRIYSETVGSLSLSRKMKTVWADYVMLDIEVHYIDELMLEQEVIKQNDAYVPSIFIPPFVLTGMLLVLSHYRLGNRSQYLQSLRDLQTLLIYDDGRYVPLYHRDMSWQILGICQHVVGDLHGALHSYQESLRQEQYHKIRTATENRIAFVERQLHRNRHA